jgi:hypothetical protein
MSTITWTVTEPAGSSAASSAASFIRGHWSDITNGFHEFMDSTGSTKAGVMRFPLTGFVSGTTGRLGGADNGTLALPVDETWWIGSNFLPRDGGLQHFGSENTYMLGHAQHEEHINAPSNAPFTARWVTAQGRVLMGSIDSSAVSLGTIDFGVNYNAPPMVHAMIQSEDVRPQSDDLLVLGIEDVRQSGCSSRVSFIDTSGLLGTIQAYVHWISSGTVEY